MENSIKRIAGIAEKYVEFCRSMLSEDPAFITLRGRESERSEKVPHFTVGRRIAVYKGATSWTVFFDDVIVEIQDRRITVPISEVTEHICDLIDDAEKYLEYLKRKQDERAFINEHKTELEQFYKDVERLTGMEIRDMYIGSSEAFKRLSVLSKIMDRDWLVIELKKKA